MIEQRIFACRRMIQRVIAQHIFVRNCGRNNIAIAIQCRGNAGDLHIAIGAADSDRIDHAATEDRGPVNRQCRQTIDAGDGETAILSQRSGIRRSAVCQIVFIDDFFCTFTVQAVNYNRIVCAVNRNR